MAARSTTWGRGSYREVDRSTAIVRVFEDAGVRSRTEADEAPLREAMQKARDGLV